MLGKGIKRVAIFLIAYPVSMSHIHVSEDHSLKDGSLIIAVGAHLFFSLLWLLRLAQGEV